jgi:uncharacterized coiled-coil DUF342 family protein
MDPISITTGILTSLSTCIRVAVQLKQLRDGAQEAKPKINALLSDIDSFRGVLQSMESTFEEIEVKEGFQTTGHLGAHWQPLNKSIEDANITLNELSELLKDINRNGSKLDSTSKHLRLNLAAEKIANYRQQVQTYRDAMQFSLQSIIL